MRNATCFSVGGVFTGFAAVQCETLNSCHTSYSFLQVKQVSLRTVSEKSSDSAWYDAPQ